MARKLISEDLENRRYYEAYLKSLEVTDPDEVESRRISMLGRIGSLLSMIESLEKSGFEIDWEMSTMLEYYKILYRYHQYEDVALSGSETPREVTRVIKLMFFSETSELENEGVDYAILDGCYVATRLWILPPDRVLEMLRKEGGVVRNPETYGLPSDKVVNYQSLQWDGNDEYDRLIGRKYGPLSDYFLYNGTTEFPVVLSWDTYAGERVVSPKSYKYASSVYYK